MRKSCRTPRNFREFGDSRILSVKIRNVPPFPMPTHVEELRFLIWLFD
jgi:hypothetical protein